MDEANVQFLLTPSFSCSTKQNAAVKHKLNFETEKVHNDSANIFMLVMTLSAPKNLKARNFVRSSIKKWEKSTSRSEGILILNPPIHPILYGSCKKFRYI